MRQFYSVICGALLAIGLANIVPTPASAGTYYDSVCNCRRPDSEYTTRRYERAPARVVNRERVVEHTKVVRGNTRLIQENRLIVHVRPVINREVVVHRTNTIVKDLVLHKVNTTNRVQEENRHETINRYAEGSVRHVTERREVRGVNCNCGYGGGSYSGGSREESSESDDGGEGRVSYRY
jgi:hypothetical protein